VKFLSIPILLACAVLMLAATSAGAKTTHPQWITQCSYDHSAMDDPILFPGQTGASHMHQFGGAKNIGASTTLADLQASPSTCKDTREHSGYWVPALYDDQERELHVTTFENYWSGPGQPIPDGMQFIVGDKTATGPVPHVSWQCQRTSSVTPKTPTLDHPYDCTPWGIPAVARFVLPTCWTGNGVTRDNFAYPPPNRDVGPCTDPAFPVRIIKAEVRVRLGTMNPLDKHLPMGMSLFGMHLDFFSAWEPGVQEHLIQKCLVAQINCGVDKGQL